MKKMMCQRAKGIFEILLVCLGATGVWGGERGRGMASAPPPIEPSNLFTIPTGKVIESLDMEVSGAGILFGEDAFSSLGTVVLGLGDIAEMQVGTLQMLSSLKGTETMVSTPGGGLKVYLPLWRNVQGVAASFRRSGTYEEEVGAQIYRGKVGEFDAVVSLANFADAYMGATAGGGWNGIKVKAHVGMHYTDASLTAGETVEQTFWKPIGGLEVWKGDSRARIVAELGWVPHFTADGNIEEIRSLIGGVRFFFSKHVTFDIGVRHQNNFGGLSESTIQTRLHMAIPTHLLRERVVGL